MTHRIRLILALCVCTALLGACYKDLSTEATTTLPEVMIGDEEEDAGIINVAYGQMLELDPEVSLSDGTKTDFSYKWEIDLQARGNANNRLELGTEKALSYKVGNSPSNLPYILSLTATDNTTGLSKLKYWKVYVSSSLGEGILVAHTRDGGKTADVDLVTAKSVSYGFNSDEPLITRDLYSFANGGNKIEGPINALVTSVVTNGATFNTTRIMLGTNEHIIALDPLDYSEMERDATLFNSKESYFHTEMLFNFGDYATSVVIGGKFFCCIGNFDRAYTKVPVSAKETDVFAKNNTAWALPDQGKVLMFHPSEYNFHWASILSVQGGMQSLDHSALGFSLQGAKAIAGGGMRNNTLGMILQLADASYQIITWDLSLINPVPKSYTIENAPDIDKAVAWAFCDNADIIYYSTGDKVYSVIISGGKTAVKTLSWKPDSDDERVTGLYQYSQNWYGTCQNSFKDYPFVLDYHRMQMVVTTYNAKTGEGKFYLRPYSVSTGLFTMKDNGSYGGFGEITAIATTPR